MCDTPRFKGIVSLGIEMTDPDPYSDNPYNCLGIPEDASKTEVKLAAAKAKSKFNPDGYPEGEKKEARLKVYRVRAAEEAISGSGTYPPDDELTRKSSDSGTDTGSEAETKSGSGTTSGTDESDTDDESGAINVSASEPNPSVGESLTVTATVDGDSLSKGTVKVDSEQKAVIRDGTTTISFDSPGLRTIKIFDNRETGNANPGSTTIEVQPRDRSIGIFCDSTEVAVGEPVNIEVRYDDGTRVSSGIIKTDRDQTASIDRGQAELTFKEPGEVTLEAIVNEGSAAEQRKKTNITITDTETQLTITPFEPTVSEGESISFTVRDENGSIVEGATVKANDKEATTDTVGRAELTFETTGEETVIATKDGNGVNYLPAETEVTVEQDNVDLALELVSDHVSVGDRLKATVWTETGSRASDIPVQCVHEESGAERKAETDDLGKVHFQIEQGGKYTISAGKSGDSTPYNTDSEQINIDQETLGLTVIPARKEAAAGEEIRFTVRDSQGRRVDSALIQSNGQEMRADQRGVGSLQFDSPGEFEVRATKDAGSIQFEPGSAEVYIED